MEAKTNYSMVGLLVLILGAGLVAASIWLSVGFDKKSYQIYVVYMHEAVSGLSEDAPVKYNGVKVGYVKSIRLNEDNPQEVQILLNIEHGTPITVSTTATLISQGITGTTYVGLAATSSDLTPLKAKKGELYPIIRAKPSLFNQLDGALKGVSENINGLTNDIKQMFDKQNANNIKNILINSQKFTDMLDRNTPEIERIIKNIAKASDKFPNLSTQFGVSMTSLAQETIPSATSLLNHLNQIAVNLEKVSRELRNNPSIIVRGTTAPKSGPGE